MSKEIEQNNANLYIKIADLLKSARESIVSNINLAMDYTYYEIGNMIVGEEQKGEKRAEYGKQLLKQLSLKLSKDFGKGFTQRNLELIR